MITSRTRLLAIIGDPVEHSLTPRIQNLALQQASIDAVNVAFRVPPVELEQAVEGALRLGFLGLMVTIPHKEAVLRLCDRLDDTARTMGAANLLHFSANGIIGYSSDGWAAVKSLAEEGVAVQGSRVAILGGGGAARSLALTFALEGAVSLLVLNRTLERAQKIVEEVNALPDCNTIAEAARLEDTGLAAVLVGVNLLVNATSVGMHPHEEATPVPSHLLHPAMAVYDIVYNPLETRLLREARRAGARCVDGVGMLVYTNVRAVEVCTGAAISASLMRAEALAALGTTSQ